MLKLNISQQELAYSAYAGAARRTRRTRRKIYGSAIYFTNLKKKMRMSVNIRNALVVAAAVVLSIPSASAAYDFVADGIYYKITDSIANEVEVTNKYDYYGCDYSGAIIIPDSVVYGDVTYAVTAIGVRAFYYGDSVTSVEIPSSVTTICDSAFYYATSLTSVEIPSGVTRIESYAFSCCDSLTSVEMPGVTSIGDFAFWRCDGLKSVSFLENGKLTSIDGWAFYCCDGLTNVTIPSGVTSIGQQAFSECYYLVSIEIPSGTIGKGICYRDTALTTAIIGSDVDSIGYAAFGRCTSLSSVTIGESVTYVGESAFNKCAALKDVFSLNTTPPECYSNGVFPTATYADATLHVPATAVEIYAGTYPWSNFTNIAGDAESGIHNVEADAIEPAITARDGAIEVSGIDGGKVNVYSTSGALVATGEAGGSAINVPGDGIYIVRINAGDCEIVRKVAVR